jgi:hypothetical protein
MASYYSRVDDLHWSHVSDRTPVSRQPTLLYPSSAPEPVQTPQVVAPTHKTPLAVPEFPALLPPTAVPLSKRSTDFSTDPGVNRLYILVIILFVVFAMLLFYTVHLRNKLDTLDQSLKWLQYIVAYQRRS